MEPDSLPLRLSSPPRLDDADAEAGLEEGEFGEFCHDFADSAEPPSNRRPPSPSAKRAPRQPNSSFSHRVEQKLAKSVANSDSSRAQKAQRGPPGSSLHLFNGYDLTSGPLIASISPHEETGFADFSVFAEQAAHPWCCSFAPMDSPEQRGGADGRINPSKTLSGQIRDPRRNVIMDSEPKAHCGCSPGEGKFITLEGCDIRDVAFMPPRWREEMEDQEASFGVEESVTADLASLYDDLSFESPSEDIERNVSSLSSVCCHTDSDSDGWEEDPGRGRQELIDNSTPENVNISRSQSATQETSPTSHRSIRFADSGSEQDPVQTGHTGLQCLGGLPPSDSFADFCSAPSQDGGDGLWAEFKDQSPQGKGASPSGLQGDDKDGTGEDRGSRRNSSQDSLSCRIQQLLQVSFPEAAVLTEEEKATSPGLGALLQHGRLPGSEEGDTPDTPDICTSTQGIQQAFWWPHQDIHSAVGLQFQWAGSHTNGTLLRCLGVDSSNIGLVGMKKQPASVPAFASGPGAPEPGKDSVPAFHSPRHSADAEKSPPGPKDLQSLSALSAQVVMSVEVATGLEFLHFSSEEIAKLPRQEDFDKNIGAALLQAAGREPPSP